MISTNNQTSHYKNNQLTNLVTMLLALFFIFPLLSCSQTALGADFVGSLKGVSITDLSGDNTPPTAIFNFNQNGDTFDFDARDSGDTDGSVAEYRWDFGDGNYGTGAIVTHQFVATGTYPVTLTIVDDKWGVALSQVAVVPLFPVVMEDAEDGTINGWTIYDNDPVGATITNVYDADLSSNVIEIRGDGTNNGFRLTHADGTDWLYGDNFVIEWQMKFAADYYMFLHVNTSVGVRYLVYVGTDLDNLGTATYVYHGLGSTTKDDNWHTITRDLQADLSEGQPGVTIVNVIGYLVRGNGRLDNIQFK